MASSLIGTSDNKFDGRRRVFRDELAKLTGLILPVALGLLLSPREASGQQTCFDQVRGQFSLRVLDAVELDSAIGQRMEMLRDAQRRGFNGANRIEIDDILRADFSPLSVELTRLAESSLTAPEAVQFKAALKQLNEARASLLSYVERLDQALKPTGFVGRLFRANEQKRTQQRAELEKGLNSCRQVLATCVLDLNNHSQGYRRLHESYRRIGRVVEQQLKIWQGVHDQTELGSEPRLQIMQQISNLARLKLVAAGLVTSAENDLTSATYQIQFHQSELSVVLTGLVSRGASGDLLAPARTRYEIEEQEAQARAAQEAQESRDREARRVTQIRVLEDRLSAILTATQGDAYERMLLIFKLVEELERGTITAGPALTILNATPQGQSHGWEKNGMKFFNKMMKEVTGRSYDLDMWTYVDVELLALFFSKLAPVEDPSARTRIIAAADAIWSSSQSRRVGNYTAQYKADLEFTYASLKRQWEDRSLK